MKNMSILMRRAQRFIADEKLLMLFVPCCFKGTNGRSAAASGLPLNIHIGAKRRKTANKLLVFGASIFIKKQ